MGKTLLNYKNVIAKYISRINFGILNTSKKKDLCNNLLSKITSLGIIVNEYGFIVDWNQEFYKYFPKVQPKEQKDLTSFKSTVESNTLKKICGTQFSEKVIHLIKFMQENNQFFAFKEHFFAIDENQKKINCDISAYQLQNTEFTDNEEEESSTCSPQYYLITMNLHHGEQKCNENFSHEQRIQTLGHLSGAISHDFNNILTAISGFIEIMIDRTKESDANYDDLVQIRKSVRKAVNLVDRLLAFARKQVLNFEVVDVAEKFGDISQIMDRLIGNEVDLQLSLKRNLHHVEVDPVQFEQIIFNLVLNAKQAIEKKPNGKIKVSVSNKDIKNGSLFQKGYFNPSHSRRLRPGKYLKISVKDNGCGIKRSFLHQIFDPFFSTRQKKNGTGLGLSTVFGIVQQSNGHILVNSKEKYTEFIILLPKSEKYVEIKQQRIKKKKSAAKQSPCYAKILVIEDEDGIRALFEKALNANNYTTAIFENADDAIAYLEESGNYDFDIVITDVIMPGTNGPEFLKYFKKHNKNVKEIMVSGYGEDIINAEFGASREFTFLSKPFSIKKLIEKVEYIIEEK